MTEARPTVFVVDDDESVRRALGNLLESVGFRAQLFASTEQFRQMALPDAPSCLVLDVRFPGANGLDFQRSLKQAGIHVPIVFITAHGDVPMASRALRAGAVEFLMKPFQKDELLTAIHHALDRDRAQRARSEELSLLEARFAELTSREREVLELVVSGLTNKEIGSRLGISEVTTKMHRSQAMRKMNASSLAELVRMSDKLKTARPADRALM